MPNVHALRVPYHVNDYAPAQLLVSFPYSRYPISSMNNYVKVAEDARAVNVKLTKNIKIGLVRLGDVLA